MASLSKSITATPRLANTGRSALLPSTISAGIGAAGAPPGRVMPTEKLTVLPGSPVVMVSRSASNAPVTMLGLGGLGPSSYSSTCAAISARRQIHSALLEIRWPNGDKKGSGKEAFGSSSGSSGSGGAVQPAPPSSTNAGAGGPGSGAGAVALGGGA